MTKSGKKCAPNCRIRLLRHSSFLTARNQYYPSSIALFMMTNYGKRSQIEAVCADGGKSLEPFALR